MAEGRSNKGRFIGAAFVLTLLGAVVIVWAMRSTIATSIAQDELAARGLSCDERFALEVSAGFGEASIGPTRCTHEGGLLEAIELMGDVTVELDGTTPAQVDAESVRITLRDNDVRGGSQWAGALRQLNLEQRVAGLVKGLSEASGMSLPPTQIGELEVVRGQTRSATARTLSLRPGAAGTDVAAERIEFTAGPMGVGRLTLSGVTGQAQPERVQLEGRAEAQAGIAILGTVSMSGHFTLEATGLDGASPRFRLGGDF